MVTLLHGRLLQWSTYAICCFSAVVTQNVFIWWTAGESNPVLLRARQVCSQVYQQPIIDNLSYYTPSIKAILFGLGRRNRTFATWPQTTHDTISPHREILAPEAGIEPTTNWLTVNCTTAVLHWNIKFASSRATLISTIHPIALVRTGGGASLGILVQFVSVTDTTLSSGWELNPLPLTVSVLRRNLDSMTFSCWHLQNLVDNNGNLTHFFPLCC